MAIAEGRGMIRALPLLLALTACAAQPAYAEVYGPADPLVTPDEPASQEYRIAGDGKDDIRRDADRWLIAYNVLSAVDAAQTCDFLHRGVAVEANPLFGKHPKCRKVIAIKAAGSLLYWLGIHRPLNRSNPKAARIIAQLATGSQGLVVGWNIQFAFKGRAQ